jgi:hypothetical protein
MQRMPDIVNHTEKEDQMLKLLSFIRDMQHTWWNANIQLPLNVKRTNNSLF